MGIIDSASQMFDEVILNRKEKDRDSEELRELIIVGQEYMELKNTRGWKRLEKAIQERTTSLSRRLLTVELEKDMFRSQGELLGIQSLLGIIDAAIEDKQLAEEKLKEGE